MRTMLPGGSCGTSELQPQRPSMRTMARATRVPPALPHHRNGTLRSHVGSVGRAFSIASSSTVTVPVGTTQRWSFHATGGGIGVAASYLQLVSTVATGNKIATTGSAAANVGALLALFP